MNNLGQDPDILETVESIQIPFKKYAIIGAIIIAILCTLIFVAKTSGASKSIDSRLSELKQLRDEKKVQETIIFNANKKKDGIDSKIIPLKCGMFAELGARDSWENECRNNFEFQKAEIQKQAVQSVDEKFSEEIPE